MTKIERLIITEIVKDNPLSLEIGDDAWVCEDCRDEYEVEGDYLCESSSRECSFCDRDGHDIDNGN